MWHFSNLKFKMASVEKITELDYFILVGEKIQLSTIFVATNAKHFIGKYLVNYIAFFHQNAIWFLGALASPGPGPVAEWVIDNFTFFKLLLGPVPVTPVSTASPVSPFFQIKFKLFQRFLDYTHFLKRYLKLLEGSEYFWKKSKARGRLWWSCLPQNTWVKEKVSALVFGGYPLLPFLHSKGRL